MAREAIREVDSGVEVDLLVVPNATTATVVGFHGDRVKIRVTSPPDKNKANAAVIDLMKHATGARRVDITSGATSRHKTVLLHDASPERVRRSLTSDL